MLPANQLSAARRRGPPAPPAALYAGPLPIPHYAQAPRLTSMLRAFSHQFARTSGRSTSTSTAGPSRVGARGAGSSSSRGGGDGSSQLDLQQLIQRRDSLLQDRLKQRADMQVTAARSQLVHATLGSWEAAPKAAREDFERYVRGGCLLMVWQVVLTSTHLRTAAAAAAAAACSSQDAEAPTCRLTLVWVGSCCSLGVCSCCSQLALWPLAAKMPCKQVWHSSCWEGRPAVRKWLPQRCWPGRRWRRFRRQTFHAAGRCWQRCSQRGRHWKGHLRQRLRMGL